MPDTIQQLILLALIFFLSLLVGWVVNIKAPQYERRYQEQKKLTAQWESYFK